MPRRFGIPLIGKVEPPRRRRDHAGQPELRIRLDRGRFDADHQVADVRLAGLQHREPRRAIGDALEHQGLDRRLLAPVLLVGLEHELEPRALPHEPIGPEAHGLALEAVLADFLEVFLGDDPGGAGGGAGVEHQEVRPRLVEHEADPVRIGDLDRLHPIVQELRRRAFVTHEAELHVLGGERIAVVEFEPLAQLELPGEPVRALLP